MPKKTTKKTAPGATKSKQNKAAFVRSLASTTPAAEVVSKAKDAGISLSAQYVYKIRALDHAARGKAASKKPVDVVSKTSPISAKSTVSSKAPSAESKTAFVLALPKDMPAAEVVNEAHQWGLELSPAYVYNIRATAKAGKKTATRQASAARTLSANSAVVKPVAKTPRTETPEVMLVEDMLKALAAEIGLGRAIAILEAQRDAVRAVLGG